MLKLNIRLPYSYPAATPARAAKVSELAQAEKGKKKKTKKQKKTEKEQGKQRLPYSYPGATLKLPRSRPEAQPTKATTLHLPYSYPTLTLHLPYSYPIATLDSRREKISRPSQRLPTLQLPYSPPGLGLGRASARLPPLPSPARPKCPGSPPNARPQPTLHAAVNLGPAPSQVPRPGGRGWPPELGSRPRSGFPQNSLLCVFRQIDSRENAYPAATLYLP